MCVLSCLVDPHESTLFRNAFGAHRAVSDVRRAACLADVAGFGWVAFGGRADVLLSFADQNVHHRVALGGGVSGAHVSCDRHGNTRFTGGRGESSLIIPRS